MKILFIFSLFFSLNATASSDCIITNFEESSFVVGSGSITLECTQTGESSIETTEFAFRVYHESYTQSVYYFSNLTEQEKTALQQSMPQFLEQSYDTDLTATGIFENNKLKIRFGAN